MKKLMGLMALALMCLSCCTERNTAVPSEFYLTPSETAAEEAAGRLSDVIRNAMDNGDTTIYILIDNYGVDSLLKKYSYGYSFNR